MAIKPVLRMGTTSLQRTSIEVSELNTPALTALIDDMLETMHALAGAGLAAPQIGVNQRVVIFGIEKNERYPEAEVVPLTILINPIIEPLSNEMEDDWEGCLSLPGMRGIVPRYKSIRYQGFNEKGERFQRDVSGFHARVVQHECDHLDGILYPQRMADLANFGFRDELEQSGRIMAQPCDD